MNGGDREVIIFDKAWRRAFVCDVKVGARLASAYPQRFQIEFQIQRKEDKMSFQKPAESAALENGKHTLTVIETKTVKSEKYGTEQEEIQCLTTDGRPYRIWISHVSAKAVQAGLEAGVLKETENGQIEVVIGAVFDVIVVNGKRVALMKHTDK